MDAPIAFGTECVMSLLIWWVNKYTNLRHSCYFANVEQALCTVR